MVFFRFLNFLFYGFNSQSVISQSLTCQQHADCDLPHVSGGYRFLSARHCRSFSYLQFISPPIEVGESLLYLLKFFLILSGLNLKEEPILEFLCFLLVLLKTQTQFHNPVPDSEKSHLHLKNKSIL